MAYSYAGAGALDYSPCRYGGSRLIFRGPCRDLSRPYVAVLGGTETYGKFVADPFPAMTEALTGLRMVNLGLVNAGPEAFLRDRGVMEIAAGAQLVVLQVMGAQNLSNRYYRVHPRRNDRFLAATPLLRGLYREVDFTEIHFTRHLLARLHATSADRFEEVAEDLRACWVRQMKALIAAIPVPVVLVWLGGGPPPVPERRVDLRREPLVIDKEMLDALRPGLSLCLDLHPTEGAKQAGVEGMILGTMDGPAARGLPGPAWHAEIAERLGPELLRLV